MQENRAGDGQRRDAKPRIHGREEIRHPAGGKPAKMTEFWLPRHPQWEEPSPDTKIRSMSWFGRPSQRPGGPLCFLYSLESN